MQFDNVSIGKTIRQMRIQRKISQETLSGLTGIGRTHLTMIENGTKKANFETIWRLATAFGIAPHELVQKIEETISKT